MGEVTVTINRIVVHTSTKAVIEGLVSRKSEENFRNFQAIFLTLEGGGGELIDRVDKLVEFLILCLMRLKYFSLNTSDKNLSLSNATMTTVFANLIK